MAPQRFLDVRLGKRLCGSHRQSFVSGHDFSRADTAAKIFRGFSPLPAVSSTANTGERHDDYSRDCQTSTATQAKAGVLPIAIVEPIQGVKRDQRNWRKKLRKSSASRPGSSAAAK